MRSSIRGQVKVRGPPEAGCRLEPFVTKNRSLFSGVGDGSLVKSTSLHTEGGVRLAGSETGARSSPGSRAYANAVLTRRRCRPGGQPKDCRLPEVEKGAGTDEVEIYWAPHDGPVEMRVTRPD